MSLADQQWCPTSVQVTVLQARGLRIKGKGGTNDAYALMQVGKEKYQTSVVEKSVAPVWKEEAAFDLPPLLHQGGGGERGTLHVHVLHRALVGPDKQLGQAVINLLQLSEDKTRSKTEWFKLLDKTGKADKDRGEVLVDIQFTRNNMTASMFDLSAAGKSRSRLGKFKDKVRGKKKESDSDTVSGVMPSFSQILTDSEEEGNGDGEVAAGKDEKKKKKHKIKSLFSPKSNLQKNMSQSMSVLPAKNSSLSGSQSSGLNVDSSEGKKKFKFMIHKRSGSSDNKDSSSGHQRHGAGEHSNLCINGSHVYCEEPQPRTSRIGSNFSLASSGHGSMEDVPESSPPSVDSLRAVRQYSPWTEEEEEETAEGENKSEDVDELKREEEERRRKQEEEERVRRQEEAHERLAEEKRRQEEEERKRIEEEEKVRREEEERIQREEETKRQEEEERVRIEEEHERLEEEKRRLEEQERRRIEEEEKRQREEEERIRVEEEQAQEERRRQEEEERVRRQEEERKLAEEKRRLEEEERRIEEERVKKEEEERIRREAERTEEERRRQEEEERVRRQEEERKLAEEKRRLEEEERVRRQEEEHKLAEEKSRLEEERRIEEEKVRQEEVERIRREEERRREEEEEMMKRQEQEREKKRRLEEQERRQHEEEERIRKEEERRQEEEEMVRKEKEEYERLVEEKRKLEEKEREKIEAEEKSRREEEERIRVEEERRRKEQEAEEKRRLEEEKERRRIEEEEKRQREEEERIRKEEERRQEEEDRARKEKEEYERLVEEKRRLEEQERRQKEEEERSRKEEQESIRMEEQRRRQQEEERAKKEKEEMERFAEEKRKLEEQEKRSIEEEEKIKREEEEKAERERKEEEAGKLHNRKLTDEERKKKENKTRDEHKAARQQPKVAVEIPAEVTSTNPFDENCSNHPFEEIPNSPAGADSNTQVSSIQQGCQSAVSSAGSKAISTDEKDLISAQREKRPAPRPPGRIPSESRREQDVSARHLAQINEQGSDKDVKTASVPPQRSMQMITPLSQSLADTKNAESLMQSGTAKGTASVAKHSKRPAPSRPRSVEEEPSSEPKTAPSSPGNVSQGGGSERKQVPVVRSLNPFEDDDEDENEPAAQDDTTSPGSTGKILWPPPVSKAADNDAVSQAKLKSSKIARAPPPPAKKAAPSSTLSHQNADGGHVTDDTGVAVSANGANQGARDPQPQAIISVPVQRTSLQEAEPARAQSTGEEAGVKKEAPPIASRRLHPVKPLNPLEQQPASVAQGEKDNKSTGILCAVQEKMKVNDTGVRGPYSQLTREELISLVLKQETQLSDRDKKIAELELYIDNLLVRVIEEQPSILMSLSSLKKAV